MAPALFSCTMYQVLERFQRDVPIPVECELTGTLPGWIDGKLFRNGPALYKINGVMSKHMFDGLALVQCFTISGGKVIYRSKLLKTNAYKKSLIAGKLVFDEFGTNGSPDPTDSVFTRYMKFHLWPFTVTDNTCVSISTVAGRLYAMSDTTNVNVLNADDLEIDNKINLSDIVAVHLTTSHPITDSDGAMWNIGTAFSLQSHYCVYRVISDQDEQGVENEKPDELTGEIICRIPSRYPLAPSYYHSFGMSEHYIVLLEQSLRIPVFQYATGRLRNVTLMNRMSYDATDQCQFHVVSKSTGRYLPVKFLTNQLVLFHHVNTYEDGDQLVVDIFAYRDKCAIDMFLLDNLRNMSSNSSLLPLSYPEFQRFVLPLKLQTTQVGSNLTTLQYTTATACLQADGSVLCTSERFQNCVAEFPAINPNFFGKKNRFWYGISGESNPTRLVKFDVVNKELVSWTTPSSIIAEPVFLPQPETTDEDAGVLLAPVSSWSDDRRSFLVAVDAKTLREIARAELPRNVGLPYSLHGVFVGHSTLQSQSNVQNISERYN